MTPEVIAAAERLKRNIYESFEHPPGEPYNNDPDIETVCRFIATQQQEAAEREKPVTEEWLRSIGFGEDYDKSLCLGCLQAWITGDGDPEWELKRSIVPTPQTRGELLDLLKALGIQVA